MRGVPYGVRKDGSVFALLGISMIAVNESTHLGDLAADHQRLLAKRAKEWDDMARGSLLELHASYSARAVGPISRLND